MSISLPGLLIDCADLDLLARHIAENPNIAGATTNPTLMRKSGVTDYPGFAAQAARILADRPLSLEVVAEEPEEVMRQAKILAHAGSNVFVKVPVVTSTGDDNTDLIGAVAESGVQVNVTAVTTIEQAYRACSAMSGRSGLISVFAGRIADTGRDPVAPATVIATMCRAYGLPTIWASTREVYNVVQAHQSGCDYITLSPDLLDKLPLLGREPAEMAADAVRMFVKDAVASGLQL